jgi:AcrR family transcriptional regulator
VSEHETGEAVDEAASSPGQRRARRKLVTHERILGAARQLFAERGYEGASISQIATRAHVSRSAVFWHFGDKRSLFQEVCKDLLVPFREAMQLSLEQLEPGKRLFEIFATYQNFVALHGETIQTFVRWSFFGPAELREPLRKQLLWLHAGMLRDVEEALLELMNDPERARLAATGLVSLLDGNLVLGILDGDFEAGARRHEALETLARTLLGLPDPAG